MDSTLDLAAADFDALNPGFGIARDGRKEDANVRALSPPHPSDMRACNMCVLILIFLLSVRVCVCVCRLSCSSSSGTRRSSS